MVRNLLALFHTKSTCLLRFSSVFYCNNSQLRSALAEENRAALSLPVDIQYSKSILAHFVGFFKHYLIQAAE